MQILRVSLFSLFFLVLRHVCAITQEKLFTSDNKKVYYIESEYKYDWFESLTKCTRMNMSLLTIDSKQKSEDISKLVKKVFGKNIVLWVGGYAVGSNRQYTWVPTGEEFSFTFWQGSNPDYYNSEEYCMQIGWGSEMKWNDNLCTKKFGFVCEFKAQECDCKDDKNYRNQTIIINNYQKS